MTYISVERFHGVSDSNFAMSRIDKLGSQRFGPLLECLVLERSLQYRFYPHFHPYPAELVKRLIKGSVRGLQEADTEYKQDEHGIPLPLPQSTRVKIDGRSVTLPDDMDVTLDGLTRVTLPSSDVLLYPEGTEVELHKEIEITFLDGSSAAYPSGTRATLIGGKPEPELYKELFRDEQYQPSELVAEPYPVKDLDFNSDGAYTVYNWELFYHVPITIAIHLSKNHRFEEAQRWFHYVFDPTDDNDGPTPDRFWKVRPFQYTEVKLIEEILVNLATGDDPNLMHKTVNCIEAWKNDPFRPHLVARYRQTPYMLKTVTAYLDNLIAWGDSLFREDSRESINEATQVYVLAANILGVRPQVVPKKGSIRPQTYANLKSDLTNFGTVMREMEDNFLYDLGPDTSDAAEMERYNTLRSIGHALYFCVPRNDKLLAYWDTVADRLFKIRNSLNIQGIFRQLPLFEPPIDPALLAKATAAGLDVGAVISGVNQPLPLVRFQFLIQKAAEISQEVKSLGNNLLAAIEKEDNEALALLRAKHEASILRMAEMVKYQQWQEALKTLEGLGKSLANAVQRYKYYERLLGKEESEIVVAEADDLDAENLEKMTYSQSEPELSPKPIEVDIAKDLEAESGGKKMNSKELEEMQQLRAARDDQKTAGIMDGVAATLGLIPNFTVRVAPIGVGMSTGFGGRELATAMNAISSYYKVEAAVHTFKANKATKIGSYDRREQEWAFQSNLAAGEITQIYKQIRAAQIRAQIAKREWANHQTQIKFAEEIEHFISGEETSVGDSQHKKTSTQGFYAWMKREVKGLYGQVFQFAFDIAKKAERALQHELGDPTLSFLQFGYLAGKEGLLAGEKLYLDIKRMEMAYHDQNCREYELTKHVSLQQVNPLALMRLRATGSCTVALPEALFDMDCPGHYFRRIKSVAISIPCVTGPYSSVNCTLTLLKSSTRKNALLNGGSGDRYARGSEDPRFSDHFGSLQSIVTSSAQNDSGMFETNLHDERYLPFEGSGAISEWQLQLPADPSNYEPCQFDYDTISDIILHIRYTAREGGDSLRIGALDNLNACIDEAQTAGSVRLFSVRHEFPSAWAAFKSIAVEGDTAVAKLTLNLEEEHYPFWSRSRGRLNTIRRVDLFAKPTQDTKTNVVMSDQPDGTGNEDNLVIDRSFGDILSGNLTNISLPAPTGEFTLYLDDNSMENLWLALTWGKAD